MTQKLKVFKNSVRLNGKNYYPAAYLLAQKKSFDGADFIKVKGSVYFSVK